MLKQPHLVFVFSLVVSFAFPALGQAPILPPRDSGRAAPQVGASSIRGRVVSAQMGLPIRRAQVTLTGGSALAGSSIVRRTTTDQDGRYEFTGLSAGSFRVEAAKAGYLNLQYGQRQLYQPGISIPVRDRDKVERIDMALPRGGVIVLRLTDDFGDPLTGAEVLVQRFLYQADGQRHLTTVGTPRPQTTDDQGEVRVFGLMPGEYVVGASMQSVNRTAGDPSDQSEGFAPTFYPGVVSALQASPVTVRVGESVTIHLSMVASRLARVRGTVIDGQGRPAAASRLTLTPYVGTIRLTPLVAGTVAADGSFVIDGVGPGEYTIDVRPAASASGSVSAAALELVSVPVIVTGADIPDLLIVTGTGLAGVSVSGRIVYEGQRTTDSGVQRQVTLRQLGPAATPRVPVDPRRNGFIGVDGKFEIAVAQGRVVLDVISPPPWQMKSITLGGRDITDEPLILARRDAVTDLVITLTDRQSQVRGQVTNQRGQLVADQVVVIMPADNFDPAIAARYTRVARTPEGRFVTTRMRPGRYLAAVVEAFEPGREYSPEFQGQLRRDATAFVLGEGETVTLNLRAQGV